MSCGATEHEIFLADSSLDSNVVRMFNVNSAELDERDAYRPLNGERVGDVAYYPNSDTLLVATWNQDRAGITMRSFSRVFGEWHFNHELKLSETKGEYLMLDVLSDGSLFCSVLKTERVQLCRIEMDRTLKHQTRVILPCKHEGFDVQLTGNDRLLAAALDGSVAIFRVGEEGVIEPLSRAPLHGAHYPLFIGDNLLVGVASNEDFYVSEAMSFSHSAGIPESDHMLSIIPRNDRLDIFRWCFLDARNSLCLWNFRFKELFIYKAS